MVGGEGRVIKTLIAKVQLTWASWPLLIVCLTSTLPNIAYIHLYSTAQKKPNREHIYICERAQRAYRTGMRMQTGRVQNGTRVGQQYNTFSQAFPVRFLLNSTVTCLKTSSQSLLLLVNQAYSHTSNDFHKFATLFHYCKYGILVKPVSPSHLPTDSGLSLFWFTSNFDLHTHNKLVTSRVNLGELGNSQ